MKNAMWIYSVEDWFLVEGKWHHIVIVFDQTTGEKTTYVDGEKQVRRN